MFLFQYNCNQDLSRPLTFHSLLLHDKPVNICKFCIAMQIEILYNQNQITLEKNAWDLVL